MPKLGLQKETRSSRRVGFERQFDLDGALRNHVRVAGAGRLGQPAAVPAMARDISATETGFSNVLSQMTL